MQYYSNNTGTSGVLAYELGANYIRVKFRGTGRIYQYSYSKAGAYHVDMMKHLAIQGAGLNSYINRCVKYLYDR